MALTPNDVLNKQFQTTKFRDGYDQDEVDDFLDEVLAEFQRLIAENDQLKTQLAAAPAAGAPVAVADTREADALRARLGGAEAQVAQLAAQLAESQQALQTAQQQAAAGATMLDGMNSAEYLQLARRVHEEHVREGVAKRDELIAEGETKAAQMLSEAQSRSDQLLSQATATATQLTGDARAKADALTSESQAKAEILVSEAQTRRATELGTLSAEGRDAHREPRCAAAGRRRAQGVRAQLPHLAQVLPRDPARRAHGVGDRVPADRCRRDTRRARAGRLALRGGADDRRFVRLGGAVRRGDVHRDAGVRGRPRSRRRSPTTFRPTRPPARSSPRRASARAASSPRRRRCRALAGTEPSARRPRSARVSASAQCCSSSGSRSASSSSTS